MVKGQWTREQKREIIICKTNEKKTMICNKSKKKKNAENVLVSTQGPVQKKKKGVNVCMYVCSKQAGRLVEQDRTGKRKQNASKRPFSSQERVRSRIF